MVVSQYGESTAVVRLQYVSGCGRTTIKVRRKYAESKAYVRLKHGKSTVLYGNFFLAPTVRHRNYVKTRKHVYYLEFRNCKDEAS